VRVRVPAAQQWPGSKLVYYVHAGFLLTLGTFLLAAPEDWFGPSWSYFSWLPHNGLGMGTACVLLGAAQLVTISMDYVSATAVLIFLGGFTNITAGVLLGAEGIYGHQGLMEMPWMITVGAIKYVQAVILWHDYHRPKNGGAQ
jgi:hypothetical protein